MKPKRFDKQFDAGKDVSKYLDLKQAKRPNLKGKGEKDTKDAIRRLRACGATVKQGGTMAENIPFERIEQKIYFIRGKKVMLDRDLAGLHGVLTKALNQAVKRNQSRFPEDFRFQL